jgi:hypothetical protein
MAFELADVDTQGFKSVGEEEFYAYVNGYEGDIRREVMQIVDPPCAVYYDNAKGKFPDSIMAKNKYSYETNSWGEYKIKEVE